MSIDHATKKTRGRRPATPTPAPPSAGHEIELRLLVSPADIARLARHPRLLALQDGSASTRRLRTTYYDTPALDLAGRGVALRIRRSGRETVMAVKTADGGPMGDAAAVAVRREWEWPLDGDEPDLSVLGAAGIREIVPQEALPAIRPVFSTDFQRTSLVLRPGPAVEIEMALDSGEVRTVTDNGSIGEPVSEVELELKAGPLGSLFDLALELQRAVPLRIATRSKAEAGFALLAGTSPHPRAAGPLAITPATSVAEAFRHIVRGCMAHILANEACALAGDDAEGIHQMRIALRRLTSAFALFSDVVAGADTRDLAGEMRWLAGRLAPARDWDVLHGHLFAAFAERNAGDADVTALGEAVALSCVAARAHAAEAIRGPRYTALLLMLGGWLEEGRWHAAADPGRREVLDRPLGAWAAGRLDDRHRKARKAGRHLKRLDDGERHRLRVRVKKLRYAVEFLRGLHAPCAVRPYLDALEFLQATLGDLNDIAVARRMTAALARDADRPVRDAAERFAAWLDRRLRKRLATLPDAWKTLERTPLFWN